MPRMRIALTMVHCYDTEDVTGGDEFYFVGVATDGETTKPILTKPKNVNNGQNITPTLFDGSGMVFDAEVPEDRVVRLALIAFDEDASKDWSKHGDVAARIGAAVSGALKAIPNPYTAAAGMLLPFAIAGAGEIMKLDKDDELGRLSAEFPLAGLPQDEPAAQTWLFRGGSGWFSSWRYRLDYAVLKGRHPRWDRF